MLILLCIICLIFVFIYQTNPSVQIKVDNVVCSIFGKHDSEYHILHRMA